MTARRFLALGDSYTIGEGVDPADRWPAVVAAALRAEGVPLSDPTIVATTGWTTDELAGGIDTRDPRGPFDLVSLLIGVNNQYRGRGAGEFAGEFRDLLARAVTLAGDRGSRVVVVSIPDWGCTPFAAGRDRERIAAEIDAYNEVCRSEAAAAGARFVDVTAASRSTARGVAGDGLHPDAAAYRQWAERILPAAREALRDD